MFFLSTTDGLTEKKVDEYMREGDSSQKKYSCISDSSRVDHSSTLALTNGQDKVINIYFLLQSLDSCLTKLDLILLFTLMKIFRNVMAYPTSPRDNGCVDGAYNPRVAVWNVVCVPTRVAHSSRRMMVGGHMLSAPSGFQKLGLPTQYSLSL